MFQHLLVAAGLWWCAAAAAAPAPVPAPAMGGKGPVETISDKIEEKKSQEELERDARLKEIDDANRQKTARVVVLPWENEEFWRSENLRRNISIRIARPDAKFYPDIDLYQAGRKERDKSLRPVDQRAIVPDSAIEEVNAVVSDVSTIPYTALSEQDWALKAHELRELSDKFWFVDRPDLREPLFQLYVQTGRAAENSNQGSPPFYEFIGSSPVNYYWYLAGTMAWETPELLSKLNDQELNASIANYRTMLETGQIPMLKLDFTLTESDDDWSAAAFASDYKVYLNGVEKTITSDKGLLEWPPGRVDVYLKRADGHSLSDRIELDKFDEKVYFIRGVARKKMGLNFRDQLMNHPNECMPPVDGDVLNYLAIYQRLHSKAEIYIAIPVGGSTASNKIGLWRWDRVIGALVRVDDNTGGFPVRFAALTGVGLTFSGATYSPPTEAELEERAAQAAPGDSVTAGTVDSLLGVPKPTVLALPWNFQLRGHYGRLLVLTGMQYSLRLAAQEGYEDNKWRDEFQAWNPKEGPGNSRYDVTNCAAGSGGVPTGGTAPTSATGTGTTTTGAIAAPTCSTVLKERTWQRLQYAGIGVVLGRSAPIGFGYRGYLRFGWTNVPHAVDLTAHLGVTSNPFLKNPDGRVNPLVDLDFWGGTAIGFGDSVFIQPGRKIGPPVPLFGLVGSAGLTF
jgi:hypothetical protein